jgi:BASS family bile acid:Na+ symporter
MGGEGNGRREWRHQVDPLEARSPPFTSIASASHPHDNPADNDRELCALIRILQWLEEHFTVCFTVAVLLGTFVPRQVGLLDECGVMYGLVVILTLSFLKIDLADILGHAKRPGLLAYALVLNLAVMPALVYVATLACDRDMQIGLVLLAALPTGVAAAAISGMVGGRTGLTLLLCVLSSLVAPLAIPAALYVLFGAAVELSYSGLLVTLLILVAVPLFVSQVMKWLLPKVAGIVGTHGGGVSVVILCCIIMSVIASRAAFIRENVGDVFVMLAALYVAFAAMQCAGYFMGFWLPKDERLALSVGKSVMNNALGIVVAVRFFPDSPRIALVLILSEIPWSTVPALHRIYGRDASEGRR